ncbi:hypothetical protein [Streptantibioticus ferralitis]|uniref:Uncharacterized protein n=1 Tax=Streptantibioticus ferralitis TaxID=236510 RepID=A0ABT5Z7E6_9ACTN|nr:hypothetical protein [Streptantibioticus ferralitis]MDF2259752.1 hypothetical protein [Streptantibioticus ferralitis]
MTSYAFPDDLLQAQRDWYTAYRQLAEAKHPAQTTVLRRRLQRLSVEISTHPFWATVPGRGPAARMALKQMAWDAGQEERSCARS